jgi:hypothetical protein
MKNEILLLELKRMRHKVKLAADNSDNHPSDPAEEEIEIIDEEAESQFNKPVLNWTGPTPDPAEWEGEDITQYSVDPAKAREIVLEKVKRLGYTDLSPRLIDQMVEDEMAAQRRSKIDKYHSMAAERARGIDPESGEINAEKTRLQGIERVKRERPELSDPEKRKQMKNFKRSYFNYYDPFMEEGSGVKFNLDSSERSAVQSGYSPEKLNAELANTLSGLMGEYLVGKRLTISTGSPTMPKEELVTIQDADPDGQRIIFNPVGRGVRMFSSYNDFFYNTLGRNGNISDGERALKAAAPQIPFPRKELPRKERSWGDILRILPPWAKV